MKTRRINRAKRVASGCRNNGSCSHCRSSRTHSTRRRELSFDEALAESLAQNADTIRALADR